MENLKNIFSLWILVVAFVGTSNLAFAQNISDKEIKTNVSYINKALEQLKQLEPITYQYDTQKFKYLNLENGKKYGFWVDNLQTVFPEMVNDKAVSYMSGKYQYKTSQVKNIDTESLIPILVASIKELEAQVEQLRSELNQIKEAPKQ